MKPILVASALKHTIKIQSPAPDNTFDGAGKGSWPDVATVRAQVQDMLPSRGEKIADGLNVASRPSRVRIRYRNDVKASMRVLIGETIEGAWVTYRTAQIITPPAELGFRQGLEFVIEDYSTAGNSA